MGNSVESNRTNRGLVITLLTTGNISVNYFNVLEHATPALARVITKLAEKFIITPMTLRNMTLHHASFLVRECALRTTYKLFIRLFCCFLNTMYTDQMLF